MTQSLEGISAEIENRLQQISEIHDFVDEMTKSAADDDVILVCGDFNMFMLPLSIKAEGLIRKYNSWAAQRKRDPAINEQEAISNCDKVINLLNKEYDLALEVLAKGFDGVLNNGLAKFSVKDMVRNDLKDWFAPNTAKHTHHKLICTFGDSFYCGQTALSLETVLTTEEEQGTQSLFDGILHITRVAPDLIGTEKGADVIPYYDSKIKQEGKIRLQLKP